NHQPQLVAILEGHLLVGQYTPGVELIGNQDLALRGPNDRRVRVEVTRRDQRGNLAVQVLTRPLVQRVEELLGEVDRGLPLLEVLELEGGPGPGLEHQRDVVGVDRRSGQDSVVDGLERSYIGEVDVDRLADPGSLWLDVLVD